MTPEQHIENLENKMSEVEERLSQLVILMEKMNKGLYGDEENDHIGVIARQKIFNQEIDILKQEIKDIHQKNIEQDIALQTKKGIRSDLYEAGKEIISFVIKAILLVGILKGFVDKDALL